MPESKPNGQGAETTHRTNLFLPAVLFALAPIWCGCAQLHRPLVPAAPARCSGSNFYCKAENVEVIDGAIRLARQWRPVFHESFTNGLAAWKIDNFENKLTFATVADTSIGGKCLRISNIASNCDTAFGIASAMLPMRAGQPFRLQFDFCSTFAMPATLRGCRGHYVSELDWYDAAGTKVGLTPIEFGQASNKWQTICIEDKSPTNAVAIVIRLGFDSPNITKDKMIEMRNIDFQTHSEPPQFESSGALLSRPLPVAPGSPRRLAWQADIPVGTLLRFQVAGALDRDGLPGEWSPFTGPDGTPNSFFETPADLPAIHADRAWFRYRLTLATTNPAKTPSLQNVMIAGATDGPWLGPDTKPPAIIERSPTRTADAAAAIWFRLEDGTGIDPGTLRISFDDADVTRRVVRQGDRYTFTPPEPLKPRPAKDPLPNLHTIQVQATDFAGNELNRQWYILYRAPRTKGLVTIRDDGMTLIDGKPFFPIGLYSVWKRPFNDNNFDKAFGDLKAAGFNLAHTYNGTRGPDFTEFLAAAARQGIKLFISCGSGANYMKIENTLAVVAKEEATPAVIAWYLADDTSMHVGYEELRRLHEAIRDVDPSRITVQADGVGDPPISCYTKYVNSTDGFMPELYPIRSDTDQEVPKIIADMKTIAADLATAGTHRKTIWGIVQYFKGWGWPRYPTRDELWAMSYLSIIHGANGITWYTYGGYKDNHGVTDTPEVWQNICGLAGELSTLQDALVEPTGTQPPAPVILSGPAKDGLAFPSINVLLKEHAGQKYLLVANSARAEVSARLSVPGATRIDLPFEKRQITATDGTVTEIFAPYGVHVYTWK